MGQELELDESTPNGVACSLGRREGSRSTFHIVPRRSVYEPEPAPPLAPGFQVRDTGAPGSPPLGRVVAVIQTFVWPLVRPHACPEFARYHAGYTPAEQRTRRETRRRWMFEAALAIGGIIVGAILAAWLGG
jgi:hypothetical protein